MLCREARVSVVERELGRATPGRLAALERHLGRCAACAARARLETRLSSGLRALREDSAPAVDVRARVLRGIAAIPAPDRAEVRTATLAWAAAVTLGVLVGLVVSGWALAPRVAPALVQALAALRGLAAAALDAASVLLPLALVPFKLLTAMIGPLSGLAGVIRHLQPLGTGVVAVAYAAVACTILIVVGRDLRARPVPLRPEER